MTKDELLRQLREIADNLKYDKVTTITSRNRDEELKNIQNQRDVLIYQAKELENKLSNDENYQDFSYMKNQTKIYDYGARLDKISEEIAQNEANVLSNNNRIEFLDREIAACTALLSEAQNNMDQYGVELRNLGNNPTPEQDKEVMDKISNAREDMDYLKTELEMLNRELETLNQNKEELSKRAATLSKTKDGYSKLLDGAKEKEKSSKDNINHAKKDDDYRKLLQIQASIDAFNNREEYISFDFPIELEALIDDIENDKIVNVTDRLEELKAKMPETIANKNYENSEEELAENKRMQAEVLMEKLALEDKLSNSNNYLPSMFSVEAMNYEINNFESNINKYDSDIKAMEANFIRYENNRKDFEAKIEEEEKAREQLNSQLMDLRIKEAVLPTEIYEQEKEEIAKEKKRIQKEISESSKKIERLTKSALSIDLLVTLAKKDKKNLENLKNNEMKLLEAKKKSFEEKSGINKFAMAEDQTKLAALVGQLNMLKMRENAIYYDYEEALNNVINNVKSNKQSTKSVVSPIVPSISAQEKDDDKDIIAPIVAPEANQEKDDDKDIIAPIVAPEVNQEKDDDKDITAPIVTSTDSVNKEEEEEKDVVPVPISFWKKAKDKVLNKLHDKNFMRRVKAAIAATIIALTMGLGLSRCSDGRTEVPSKEVVETVDDFELPEFDFEIDDVGDIEDELDNEISKTPINNTDNTPQSKPTTNDNSNQVQNPEPIPTPDPEPEPIPDPEPEPTPDPEPEPIPDPEPEPTPDPEPEPTPDPDPEPTPDPNPEPTPDPDPEPTPDPDPEPTQEVQTVEEGQVGILQTGDGEVAVTDNVELSTGETESPQQQVANEIIDRLEQEGVTVDNHTNNQNITSSTVAEDGTITNTYDDTTTTNNPTIEDVVEQIATENHGGTVSDSTWDNLNDIFSQEYSEGGMTR